MPGKYVPSMATIARELGVSVATVSRALKGHTRHSERTRARVLETAARLGYSPNLLVGGLRGTGTRTIGVSMDVPHDFFLGILNGIIKGLWREAYVPLVLSPMKNTAGFREADILHALAERRVDGVIARYGETSLMTAYSDELRARGLPIVLVDNDIQGSDIPFAGTDDYRGGWLAAEYLAALGHRVIAHLPGEQLTSPGYGRQHGFLDYLATRPEIAVRLAPADFTPADEVVRAFLVANPDVTAIFAASDHSAWAACRAAQRLGRRVPQDLSILGFGNLTLGQASTPALSTVDQRPEQIGENAAAMVLAAIRGEAATSEGKPVSLTQPQLIVRESTVSPSYV